MKSECKDCLDSETAYKYYREHGEIPLHLPENFDLWVEFKIKPNEHSEDYTNRRIELVKYLYCELAKSDILRAYSRDRVRVVHDDLTDEEENEAIRIFKEAKELLNKTRDIDEYHHEGNHWLENDFILSDYITYLSAVYQIPTAIMRDDHKKPFWKLW